MKNFTTTILSAAVIASVSALSANSATIGKKNFDLSNFRYQIDSRSVFHNKLAKETERVNQLLEGKKAPRKAAFENPTPSLVLPNVNEVGTIDGINGELWYYTANLDYLEIPPHDEVAYTDRILQEYEFTIYDANMKVIGVIRDKVNYAENEVRTVTCEITPIATRNFFNTTDDVEIMVALAINTTQYVNRYTTVVYNLDANLAEGEYSKPMTSFDQWVADVVEGPEIDGKDNFYFTYMVDIFDYDDASEGFWDYLLGQKVEFEVYSRALDDKGPRKIFTTTIPMIQFPGDQQDVPVMISTVHNDEVIYLVQNYALPFYNRYDNPMTDDMTMRDGNSLEIRLYKASNTGFEQVSETTIPIALDPMKNSSGNPTCLFSYFSVGNLRYTGDILFDAPGASTYKPEYIVTRGNYQVSTDDIVNSFYTYNNDGTLKNTLCEYADGARAMSNLDGFEPQEMFVTRDAYGYLFHFVDLYSGKTTAKVEADYYYDDDSDPELLTFNVDRTPVGDSYQYCFEMRYPLVDDNENDILRFMYLNADGSFNHIDQVNMGTNVVYAQSFMTSEALDPHVFSTSDTPAYMFLVKRGIQGMGGNEEQLMVAEAISEENPDGKTLLQLGPNEYGALASIVPEFPIDGQPGRLLVYYYATETRNYSIEVYSLPFDSNGTNSVEEIGAEQPGLSVDGDSIVAEGEIKVYSLDGKLMASGNGSVEFASLAKGVYVIKAGGITYKVIKK